jgi:hypothetical protein
MLNVNQREKRLKKFIRSRLKKKTNIENKLKIVNEVELDLLNYSQYVDSGRKPGSMPPIKAILRFMKGNKMGSSTQVAFAIAHSIKKRGIKAIPFISDLQLLFISDLIEAPLPKKLDTELDSILNNL